MSYLRLSIHSVSPAERGVRRRFVSAPCLIAGHDAFGQGILVEVGASLPQRQGKRPMSTQMSERCFLHAAGGSVRHRRRMLNRPPVVRDFLIVKMPDAPRGASAPHSSIASA
jgi:hypothetical protein